MKSEKIDTTKKDTKAAKKNNDGIDKFDIEKVSLKALQKQLVKELDSKRYEHTLGVAYTAAAMAMRYGVDMKKAQIAGLLHDCAKCVPDEKKISLCTKNKLKVSDVERKNPGLLHAKLGGYLANKEYKINDEDILNAITNHTTGRPEMSILEKIIFIADYIEPGRKTAPNLTYLRKLSFEDIDKAMLEILENTFKYLKETNAIIDDMSEQTYLYYKKIVEERG